MQKTLGAKSSKTDGKTVPIVEEEAQISTRDVTTGHVSVNTVTDHIDEVIRHDLKSTRVTVDRVPIGRNLEAGEQPPEIRSEGDITIIPVLEEIAVVEKRLHLKEEVHILKETIAEKVELPVNLRKQRVVVERQGPDDQPSHAKE